MSDNEKNEDVIQKALNYQEKYYRHNIDKYRKKGLPKVQYMFYDDIIIRGQLLTIFYVSLNRDMITAKKYAYYASKAYEINMKVYGWRDVYRNRFYIYQVSNELETIYLSLLTNNQEIIATVIREAAKGKEEEIKNNENELYYNMYKVIYCIYFEEYEGLELYLERLNNFRTREDLVDYMHYIDALEGILEKDVEKINIALEAMSEVHSSLVEYKGLYTENLCLVALGLGKLATLKGLKVSCNNVELFHEFMNDSEVVNEEVDYLKIDGGCSMRRDKFKNILTKFNISESERYSVLIEEALKSPQGFLDNHKELNNIFVDPNVNLHIGVLLEILEENKKVFTVDWKGTYIDVKRGLSYLGWNDEEVLKVNLEEEINTPIDGSLFRVSQYLDKNTDLALIMIANNLDDNYVFSIVKNSEVDSILEGFYDCDIKAFQYNEDYINTYMINTCEKDEDIDEGFDGIYGKSDDKGNIEEIVIVESKYSDTGRVKLTESGIGKQMSKEWINNRLNIMMNSIDEEVRGTANTILNNMDKVKTLVTVTLPDKTVINIENPFDKIGRNDYIL